MSRVPIVSSEAFTPTKGQSTPHDGRVAKDWVRTLRVV